MKCVAQVEIDKHALRVLEHHWPAVERHTDVTKFKGQRGAADLVCGGFPCQDLSVAGKRAGLAGKRSGLWHEFRRVVAEVAPRWVLIENVPGLYSSWSGDTPSSLGKRPGRGREMVLEERSDLDVVTRGLAELGYGWAFRCVDLQYFSVPQRRERVFIVGCLGDAARAAAVLFESESCDGDSPPRREAGAGTARAVAACLNSGGNDGGFRTEPGEHLAIAIQDGREIEKRQNGLGIGRDTAFTLDGTGAQAVFGGNDTRGPRAAAAAAVNAGGQKRQDFETENLVVGTLPAHSQKHGHAMTTQQAAESGHLVAHQCHGSNVGPMGSLRAGNGNETGGVPFIAHTLRGEGHDASEDGTGRGVPLAAATLRSRQHSEGVNEPGRGGEDDQNIVCAIAQNQRGEVRTMPISSQLTTGGGKPGEGYPCVFTQRTRDGVANVETSDISFALDAPKDGGRKKGGVAGSFGVRRLTPLECERLQSFPDHWTALPGMSDSARYRMVGNAVPPVMVEWIGRRIMEVS